MTARDKKRRLWDTIFPPTIYNALTNGSFEDGLTGWTATGAMTPTVVADANAPHRAHVAKLTLTGSATPTLRKMVAITPEQAGQFVTAYAEYKWAAGPVKQCRLNVHYLDASLAGVTGGVNAGQLMTPVTDAWTRVQNNDNQIPATTAWADIRIIIDSAAAADALLADSVFVVVGDNIADTGPHPPFRLAVGE